MIGEHTNLRQSLGQALQQLLKAKQKQNKTNTKHKIVSHRQDDVVPKASRGEPNQRRLTDIQLRVRMAGIVVHNGWRNCY